MCVVTASFSETKYNSMAPCLILVISTHVRSCQMNRNMTHENQTLPIYNNTSRNHSSYVLVLHFCLHVELHLIVQLIEVKERRYYLAFAWQKVMSYINFRLTFCLGGTSKLLQRLEEHVTPGVARKGRFKATYGICDATDYQGDQ